MAKKSNSKGDRHSSAVRTDQRPDSKEGNVQAPEIICTVVGPGRMGKSRAIQQYLRRCGQSSADEGEFPYQVSRWPLWWITGLTSTRARGACGAPLLNRTDRKAQVRKAR